MSELNPFDEFMDALVHCDTVKVILTGCGESTFETKPIYEGICALANRQAQPANEPLTLDDLSKLSNTDWVWVVFPELASDESGWYRAKRLYDTYSKSHYGKTWLAYRRPPERSENDAEFCSCGERKDGDSNDK